MDSPETREAMAVANELPKWTWADLRRLVQGVRYEFIRKWDQFEAAKNAQTAEPLECEADCEPADGLPIRPTDSRFGDQQAKGSVQHVAQKSCQSYDEAAERNRLSDNDFDDRHST